MAQVVPANDHLLLLCRQLLSYSAAGAVLVLIASCVMVEAAMAVSSLKAAGVRRGRGLIGIIIFILYILFHYYLL